MRKYSYILDIGSSKLSLLVCTLYNKQPHILFFEEKSYDGFLDGEFLSPNQIPFIVNDLISNVVKKLRRNITKVFVGVPSEFCVCVCKRIKRKYATSKLIDEKELYSLFDGVDDFNKSNTYKPLSFSAMQYVLDDDIKTINPIKKRTKSITMDCSYVLAKKSFVEFFDKLFANANIKSIEYTSSALGQAVECTDKNSPLSPVAVVDVGHLTTSVAVVKGEGLALLSSFSLGGGHISSDLMQLLKISYSDAEAIKKKVMLSVKADRNERYEVSNAGRLITSHIQFTNEIVKSRIENIANIVSNILDIDEMFRDIPIYLTGDGIANFKGVLPIFSTITNRQTLDYTNRFDYTDRKHQTSANGLCKLIYTLESNKGE